MESSLRNARKVTAAAALTAVLSAASLAQAQDPASQPAVSAEASASATVQAPEVTTSTDTTRPAAPAQTPLELKLDIGLGLRTDLTFDPDREGDEDAPVYALGYNLRPYISGQVHRNIKFEGNLDSAGNNIRVLDAILKLEFNDYANFWFGHFLPPSDRSNLSGPYFLNAWVYPGVHTFPNEYAGRDDGFAYWGQYAGGVVKWQLGFFGMPAGGTPDPRFAGRVTVNLFDPEPGYYNSSTYYGGKDILAFGATLQHQPAPDEAPDEAANTLWSLDALFEKNFGVGVLDVEGAFYGFGGADQGTSFFVLGSFMFPEQVGIGNLQPMLRIERLAVSEGDVFNSMPVADDASRLGIDAGLNYIINGHNARLAATLRYTSIKVGDADAVTDTVIILGGQIQAF